MIRYLDKVIRLLALILPKMSGYVKKIEGEVEDEDKYKTNELISSCRVDEKRLLKYKTLWTKIEDLKR